MRKVLLSLILPAWFILCANAGDLSEISYKDIKQDGKIRIENDVWTDKIPRRSSDYFIKTIPEGNRDYSEFLRPDGSFAFTTGCQYEFLHKGDLISYSSYDLKFYDFTFVNDMINRRELTEDEVQELFPDYKIIKISDFSHNTGSLKIKKNRRNMKIIILNDTDRTFHNYSYTSGNARFDTYRLTGFIDVKTKGMIQFSHFGDNTKNYPWFVLLVR